MILFAYSLCHLRYPSFETTDILDLCMYYQKTWCVSTRNAVAHTYLYGVGTFCVWSWIVLFDGYSHHLGNCANPDILGEGELPSQTAIAKMSQRCLCVRVPEGSPSPCICSNQLE